MRERLTRPSTETWDVPPSPTFSQEITKEHALLNQRATGK